MDQYSTHSVIWDDIVFSKNQISFRPGRLQAILPAIPAKGVIPELNLIKAEYFHRLYGRRIFKLSFSGTQLLKDEQLSPGWPRLLDALEFAQQLYQLEYAKDKHAFIHRAKGMTNIDLQELYQQILQRSEYLKFLASRLDHEFRLIPIVEYSNGQFEDSFLFRFRNKRGHVLVIWENLKPGRATHVFKYEEQAGTDVLQKIESFIMSEAYHKKRSRLTSSTPADKKLRKELYYHKKYSHKSFVDFKTNIEYLLLYS